MFTIKPIDHELEKKRKWFAARDVLFGENGSDQIIPMALRMMQEVDHDDARWLVSLFPNPVAISKEEVHQLFVSMYDIDPRAKLYDICTKLNRSKTSGYASTSAETVIRWEVSTLKELANSGYPLAGLRLIAMTRMKDHDLELYLKMAIDAGEPEAYYILGSSLLDGSNLNPALALQKQTALIYFYLAADLGYAKALLELGNSFDFNDPQHHYYYGGQGAIKLRGIYLKSYVKACTRFLVRIENTPEIRQCRYRLGEALAKHFNPDDSRIRDFHLDRGDAHDVEIICKMYRAWCMACKRAIDSWTVIAMRNNIPKDVRLAVARWLSEKRSDADYVIDSK